MYSYDSLVEKLNIDNSLHRVHLKSILNALVNNNEAFITKQKIDVDISKIEYLWELYLKLFSFFDYKYNTKIDITKFFSYLLNENELILNAIFCPGYTDSGYKDYIGSNNSERILKLKKLKEELQKEKVKAKFNISLANIFLENTDSIKNRNWNEELSLHVDKFFDKAKNYFDESEIIIFSDIFSDEKYIRGFIDTSLLEGKNYHNFYKNNESFYKKMNWSSEETKDRNDKLYTIYTIISEYISKQQNGIYLPMETMYSRSKVMTHNNVCTMYLHK